MNKNIFPKTIADKFIYSFSVQEFGLYSVTVVASCRSAAQAEQKGGEDLLVEIDGRRFREVPAQAKPQYQDVSPAWNGSQLKGLSKTVVFLLLLDSGEHEIVFIPDNGATLEAEPHIKFTTEYQKIIFNIEEVAKDGDRRPWFTFALIDVPLKSFSADITTHYRFRDSDDAKLLVDGQIQKNIFSILHRDWIWSANILTKIFNVERKKKAFEENLSAGVHYIDFWADRMPTLYEVIFDLGVDTLKRIPSVGNPKWTGNFNDDTEQMILARLIFGEAENQSKEAKIGVGFTVLNRVKKHKKQWGYNIHEVILKESQYDSFWNKNTKDKVRNPLENIANRTVWNESYESAGTVLGRQVADPTFGATHFHSFKRQIDFPIWATEKNFKIKIDKIYFYELEA